VGQKPQLLPESLTVVQLQPFPVIFPAGAQVSPTKVEPSPLMVKVILSPNSAWLGEQLRLIVLQAIPVVGIGVGLGIGAEQKDPGRQEPQGPSIWPHSLAPNEKILPVKPPQSVLPPETVPEKTGVSGPL